ncbi:MAG: hypothetical protein HFF78_01385, partial [Oscillospiraceae bacterium]|nr:hypothetical protein [Oscillospiraceae bacterium]
TPGFKAYQQQIVKNSAALADGLTRRGMKLVSGGPSSIPPMSSAATALRASVRMTARVSGPPKVR